MKIKSKLLILLSFGLVFLMIFYTQQVTNGAYNALVLSATSVIPALFPFFVVSGILVNTGAVHFIGKAFSPLSKVLFKTQGVGAFVFLMGFLCGYPTGAKITADMYKSGQLTKKESERLLAFCNNSGPLFVIGAVGNTMLGSKKIGIILYLVHALSAVVTGVVFSLFSKEKTTTKSTKIMATNFSQAITKSVETALKSILSVCAYVVFFGSVIQVIKEFTKSPVLLSLLEVTTGAKEIIASGIANDTMLVLLSGAMAFGGICVFFQVRSVVGDTDLSCRTYLFGKIFQAMCASLFTKLYLWVNADVVVFSPQVEKTCTNGATAYLVIILLLFTTTALFRLTKKN